MRIGVVCPTDVPTSAPPSPERSLTRRVETSSAPAARAREVAGPPRVESTPDLLRRAAVEASEALPDGIRQRLTERVNADFSRVRVHSGCASAAAAHRIGARAYTLGADIHLGGDAYGLTGQERARLLVHEAVHTVQQGSRHVLPHASLRVSQPSDAAEQEAAAIARMCEPAGPGSRSPSLMLRDTMRAGEARPSVVRTVAPHLQRDLTGSYKAIDGTFKLNLKTESHPGAKNGMSGTIKFSPKDTAPDSPSIRLLQIAKLVDSGTGKDYAWTGGEANRNKVMTAATPGVTGGFFVDVLHKNRTPRNAKADAPVSPYYIDDYAALASPDNRDGSKKGKTITDASLWDYPGWDQKSKFSFETAAKGADTGYVYATMTWGFTISDPAKGTVAGEYAKVHETSSLTLDAAVGKFDEFYKNPGASTAPK